MLFAGTSDGTLLNFEFPDGDATEIWTEEEWAAQQAVVDEKSRGLRSRRKRHVKGRRGSVTMMDATNFTSFSPASMTEDLHDRGDSESVLKS
jgi:hypothetical protein